MGHTFLELLARDIGAASRDLTSVRLTPLFDSDCFAGNELRPAMRLLAQRGGENGNW